MNKDIIFSAEEVMIQQAQQCATAENTTLNGLFRVWLERYVSIPTTESQFKALTLRLAHVQAGRNFSREEMNERR